MKYFTLVFCLFLSQILLSQNIILNKVEQTGNFEDRFFYKIDEKAMPSIYLGELEVQGYSQEDEAIFNAVYKKAKSIGANAFSLKQSEMLDGSLQILDPHNYVLNLYEIKESDLPDSSDELYLISASSKVNKISINDEVITLLPRSYHLRIMTKGEFYRLSTRKLLGSSVNIKSNINEGQQYFTISTFKLKSNTDGVGGVNIKTGDITKIERSYGDFLTMIYSEVK